MYKLWVTNFCFLLGFFSIQSQSIAQESTNTNFLNRASQYYLGQKDEILIKVNIWGYVLKPGQYMVPRHTDLISLISFAGGPKPGANLGEVKIIRVKIADKGHNGMENVRGNPSILKVDVSSFLQTGKSTLIPALEVGDTVLISQTLGNKFREFLGVTSIVGLMAATATLIIAINAL